MASEPVPGPNSIRFGEDFELNLRAYELRSRGIPIKLKPIPFELLRFLVERHGQLVTRDQIVERVWGKGVFLDTDNSINGAISKIRQVLRDDAEKPRYIQTVSGKGYRFVAAVDVEEIAAGPVLTAEKPRAVESIIGQRVADYRIIQLLGGGGMGVVYKAEDLKLGRQVALKFLPAELASDALGFERLQQEARAASALDHPNICSIYQLGEHDGKPFIVMQLLEGQTLREWIDGSAALGIDTRLKYLLDFAVQIADGLEAAHEKGIIHRDIKPANIFITTRDQVKILDFGVAKFIGIGEAQDGGPLAADGAASEERMSGSPNINLTRTGISMGTPSYVSPEQARNEKLDARTDLFSFGVVLYEMATGTRAFPGKTVGIVRDAVLNDPVVPVRKLNPDVPPELERIINHALEKDKNTRFQTAAELRNELLTLKKRPEPTVLAAAAQVETLRRPLWQKVAALAAGAAIVLGGATYYYRATRPKLTDRDTVVLGEFANTTGDPVFDEALRQGLEVELGQSPFLSVISAQKVADALTRMGKAPGDQLTVKIRRELCLRTGSAALLGGGISSLGSHYLIDLSAIACSTGDPLAHEQGEATNKEDVLKTLSQISSRLRSRLGESLPSIQKFEVPIGITTSSLEALKNFGMCVSVFRDKGEAPSIPFCKRAIDLDPNFPLAYAVLSVSYLNLRQMSLAQEYVSKAYALKDRASEPEKLRIIADYYGVAGDLENEVATYELWIKEYPRDDESHTNLGVDYNILGQNEKSLEEAQRALALAKDDVSLYQNVAGNDLALGRLQEAQASADEALQKHMDGSSLRYLIYQIAFLRGDSEKMQEQMAWAAGESVQDVLLSTQGDTEAYYGKLKSSAEFTRRAVELDVRSDAKENAGSWQVGMALRYAEAGDDAGARRAAQEAMRLSSSRDVSVGAALALARSGDVARAEPIAMKLAKDFPTDTMLKVYVLPCVRAAIALQKKNPAQALSELEIAIPYELGGPAPPMTGTLYPAYLRGEAYLMANNGSAAAAEFQKLLHNRGLVLNFITGATAHLQLGRAYAAAGDKVKAGAAYRDFLTVWKDADPGLPLLGQAKREYAKLQ